MEWKTRKFDSILLSHTHIIGVFAKGAGGAAAPPVSKKFGQNATNSGKMPEFLAFF